MENLASAHDSRQLEGFTAMSGLPKITFGIIVLNGEPFTRYNLRALYPFAHQIIVVEGACPAARHYATTNGHSIDGTLGILRRFKVEEDPDDKLVIVTAEDEGYPDGFWSGEKDEQSQAYAKRATGDWLWQVDSDEFYQPQDMHWVCEHYLTRSDVWAISFKQIQFWGGLNYFVDGWYLRHCGGDEFHRLFRWRPGYSYISHRPPTVVNEKGIGLRQIGWISGHELSRNKIYLYHYSLVFPSQVRAKSKYYSEVSWGSFNRMSQWAEENYNRLANPYRVHNTYHYPSWLEHYRGQHPSQVLKMWSDIECDHREQQVTLRRTDDIEQLLRSRYYFFGKTLLRFAGPVLYHLSNVARQTLTLMPSMVQKRIRRILSTILS
jgi:hypothetical protein